MSLGIPRCSRCPTPTKLCVLQPINHRHEDVGKPLIAVDPKSEVGYGETVAFVTSGDATLLEEGHPMPIDAAVVGIVDSLDASDDYVKQVGSLRAYKKY